MMEPSQTIPWNGSELLVSGAQKTTFTCHWRGSTIKVDVCVKAKTEKWPIELRLDFQDGKKVLQKKITLEAGERGQIGIYIHPDGRGVRVFNLLKALPEEEIKEDATFFVLTAANNGIILSDVHS